MIRITIDTSGAAFDGDPRWEAARILDELREGIQTGSVPAVLRDSNGNRCGDVLTQGAHSAKIRAHY